MSLSLIPENALVGLVTFGTMVSNLAASHLYSTLHQLLLQPIMCLTCN